MTNRFFPSKRIPDEDADGRLPHGESEPPVGRVLRRLEKAVEAQNRNSTSDTEENGRGSSGAPPAATQAVKKGPEPELPNTETHGAEAANRPAARDGNENKPTDFEISPAEVDFQDPLLLSLRDLAALLNRPISLEALKAGLPYGEARFTPELAVRAAERAGLTARITRRPKLAQILPVTLPCVLLLREGNACVLLNYDDKGNAEVLVPEGGGAKRKVALADLEAQYDGYAVFARTEYRFDQRASRISLSESKSWFWGTLRQFWPVYSHVMLASVMINIFAIASPLFIMNVYDRVVPNQAIETLWVLAAGVLTVFVFEFVLRNLRTYFVDIAGKNADVIIASKLLQQLMGMKLASKGPSTGAMANNLREFESLREFFTSGTLVAFVDLPFIFLFLLVIWIVGGPLAYIPLAAVPLVLIFGAVLQKPLQRIIEQSHKESTQKHALLVETIDGLETVKAVAGEGRVQRTWERFVGLTARSAAKARFLSALAVSFSQVSIQVTTVAVVVAGVYLIGAGEITLGALIASSILTGRALAPLSSIAALLTRLQQSRVALKSLDELMNAPREREDDKTFLHRPKLSGALEFKNVSFAYPGQQSLALDRMSLKIAPGEKIGILGRIGSGKSTLARLLLGLYEPAEGSILADGTDIRQIDPADLRRNIGYVSQDNYLFFGTVRENISFAAPHVGDESVLRAARIAGVNDFLRNHPLGFDMQVGERGMGLSGGQRQSIVIARALLLDPPILLFDEPTSSMDNSTETAFKARLQRDMADKTLVLVTHRGSLLSLVDRLVILDQGRVVADGPRDKVLEALKQGQIRVNRDK